MRRRIWNRLGAGARARKAARPQSRPALEPLEPRLLLSADPLGAEPPAPMDVPLERHAVCIDLDQGATQEPAAVYRFWSPVFSRHCYTSSASQRDTLIDEQSDVWTYEGEAYHASSDAGDPNLSPVYHFWSEPLGTHFYTCKESEKTKLVDDYPHVWTLEGAAFYAQPEGRQPAGAEPVYRFWSGRLNSHFYTTDQAERDKLIDSYPHIWTYEGIAWYAATTTEAVPVVQRSLEEEEALVVEGNNRFAMELYRELCAEEGNLFFSPYSISAALAMTYAGAEGDTEQEMAETLRFPTVAASLQGDEALQGPLTEEAFAAAFGRIINDLNARGGQDTYELRVANALWGQMGYPFLQAFLTLVETEYGGKLEEVDFITAAEEARVTINTWVEEQTNGKITDLIPEGVLNEWTRLVLTNAIYFKGNWASPFEEERTQEAAFTLLDGSQVQAPMMNQALRFAHYAETGDLQILELPYEGGELSMVILLPRATDGITDFEQALTAENLAEWLAQIRRQDVYVSIPRFTMTSEFSLNSVLGSMGMPLAFTPPPPPPVLGPMPPCADFTGMTPERVLYISAVVHKAYVDVNEEGTEAAAATAVVMASVTSSPVYIPFRADHPFIFLIRDNASGSILFLGRVMDPTA